MDKNRNDYAFDEIQAAESKDRCRIPVAGNYILSEDEIIAKRFEYEFISVREIAEQLAPMRGTTLKE